MNKMRFILRHDPRATVAAVGLACAAFSPAQAQTLNLGGVDASMETLDGYSDVTNAARVPAVLTVGAKGTSSTYAGTTEDGFAGIGRLGVIKAGAGTWTLTGANTQNGDTFLTFPGGVSLASVYGNIPLAVLGGTVAFNNAAALGGGVVAVSNATLASTGAAPITVTNTILVGVTAGATATFDTTGGDLNIASAVVGYQPPGSTAPTDGGLIKQGAGRLTLNGANNFAGGVTVASGTLAFGSASALGSGPVTLADGTVLASQLASVALGNAIILSGASGATIDTGAGALALNGVVSGSGGLTKTGSGTLTLGVAATYAGNTQIVAGSLATGADNALNPLTNVTVNSGASLNLRGHVLTLASVGGTGTITAGNGAANLALGGTGASFAFNGLLTDGAGQLALTKQGAGTLTLGSANSFSGGVTILAGSLVVGNASALGSGPILMDDGTTLAFTLPSMTVVNPITFTGVADPTIDTGAGTITFTSPITGAGALTKIGSGALVLTGASTYTGATAVAQGTLEVDGSIISPTTIYSGATLRGVGAVGSIDLLSGALLAPGNAAQPFGTLFANGSVNFAPGSSFSVALSPTGSSQLVVTGAATLGGTVVANWSGGTPTLGATYKILSASGGVTSAFYGLSVNGLTTLLPVLAYDSNDAYLVFNGLTKQAVQSSFQTQADGRFGALVTYHVLASMLDGFNEQINCSNCVTAFGSVGSLSAGVHGRYSISDDLALLGGAAYAQYHSGDVQVTSSPIFLAALRYDQTERGASRPFAEIGAAASPWQNVNYRRDYFDGAFDRQGRSWGNAETYEIFGKAGWVSRWSPIDEGSVYAGLSRVWQSAGGFAESSLNNSAPATIQPGTDAINIARVGAQWTHLFAARVETQVNIALAQSFASESGLKGSVLGYNAISTHFDEATWAEYGLRIGYRVANGVVADVFADGTLGAQPVGATIHGGVDLRYAF